MKYNVNVRSGNKGNYYKNYLELTFNYKDQEYTVEDLFNRIFALEEQLKVANAEIARNKEIIEAKQEKINALMLESIKQLSAKVGRLEYKQNNNSEVE